MPITVDTKSVASMTAMIRAKQLAQEAIQDRLLSIIAYNSYATEADSSGEELAKKINNGLDNFYAQSLAIRESFLAQQKAYKSDGKNFVEEVGYPILFSKTHLQLGMAKDWAVQRDESLIHDIINGEFYHNLGNDVALDALPVLASSSTTSFWGNENASVTSILLASIASILNPGMPLNLTGAMTFYPFYNEAFTIEIDAAYPFASTNGMKLFGDYQFGAHRYFSKPYPGMGQQLFAGEDCSSAVAKATGLTEAQVVDIYTGAIKDAYSNPDNVFGYKAITDAATARAGDIYLRGNHTAIIAEISASEVNTLGFNREIDCLENKQLGGGSYKYNLDDSTEEKPIFILRSSQEPLHESSSLAGLLSRIDYKYNEAFDASSPQDIAGDCYNFFVD